jgi:hypothetical protein
MMIRAPIFICGVDRSGKTLLRLMLAEQPHILFSRRTNFWSDYYKRFGDLSKQRNFERCLDAMGRNKHLRLLMPDFESIRGEFVNGESSYARLFAIIHEQYTRREGKARWGDQSELIEHYADVIFDAYPDARIIHMIRDPRDQYAASKSRKSKGKHRVGDSVAYWRMSASLAMMNASRYPLGYRIVHYETMVTHAEETMRDICDFIGEAYLPCMLTMQRAPRFSAMTGKSIEPGDSPLTQEFIGHYRKSLSSYEIAFIEKFARKHMLQQGYLLDGEAGSFHLSRWGMDLARLLTWQARSFIRGQFVLNANPRV